MREMQRRDLLLFNAIAIAAKTFLQFWLEFEGLLKYKASFRRDRLAYLLYTKKN